MTHFLCLLAGLAVGAILARRGAIPQPPDPDGRRALRALADAVKQMDAQEALAFAAEANRRVQPPSDPQAGLRWAAMGRVR